MLSHSIVFLHYASSSAFLPSCILLGIPWVPSDSCLAPAKWDSVQGQRKDLICQLWTWLERRGMVRCAVLGVCVCGEIDTFSFIYCNNAPPYYIFFPFKTL